MSWNNDIRIEGVSCVGGQAATLTLLPTHFFFIFLYYTDVGSLTLVLAAYLVRFARSACGCMHWLGTNNLGWPI